jgi:hypothetical protein
MREEYQLVMITTIFSCKGLSPKECLALQILGYTTISLLSEKFEEDPQILMSAFVSSQQGQGQGQEHNPLEEMIKSVNICPVIWEVAAAPENFFAKLLELDAKVKTRQDLDTVIEEIRSIENDVPELFRIIEDLFMNECLSDVKIANILSGLLSQQSQQQPQQQSQQQPQQQQQHQQPQSQKHRGRSKTLRVHGRRAITPIKNRHRRPETKTI